MTLEIKRYTHIPLTVEAVQITSENMAAVAEWCGGTIQTDGVRKEYIRVAVLKPLNERQTCGYVGDWVLKTDIGLKIYLNRAFRRAFVEAGIKVLSLETAKPYEVVIDQPAPTR